MNLRMLPINQKFFFAEIFNQFCENLSNSENLVKELEKLVSEWFNTDDSDIEWKPLTDDEIVNFITNAQLTRENNNNNENYNNEESNSSMDISNQIFPSEALEMFKKLCFEFWRFLITTPRMVSRSRKYIRKRK